MELTLFPNGNGFAGACWRAVQTTPLRHRPSDFRLGSLWPDDLRRARRIDGVRRAGARSSRTPHERPSVCQRRRTMTCVPRKQRGRMDAAAPEFPVRAAGVPRRNRPKQPAVALRSSPRPPAASGCTARAAPACGTNGSGGAGVFGESGGNSLVFPYFAALLSVALF
jgi:hypothetical protein